MSPEHSENLKVVGEVRLRPYRSDNAIIAWIDVLNASKMTNEDLEKVSMLLASVCSIPNSNAVQAISENDPIKRINSLLIGDAICITQACDDIIARQAAVSFALDISQSLFALSLAHRGVIVQGPVRCGPDYSNLRGCEYITGRGVIEAFKCEQMLKVTGISISSDLCTEVQAWRHSWKSTPLRLIESIGDHTFVTTEAHLNDWRAFAIAQWQSHSYTAAAKALLDNN